MFHLALLAAAPLLQTAPADAGGSLDDVQLGGRFHNPFAPPASAGAMPNRIVEITLNLPGRAWQESFLVGIPQNLQVPAPSLTVFHGYGEEPRDVLENTPLVRVAMARGWVVLVPLGAHKYNYGIEYAQRNVEDVFAFVAPYLVLDLDRAYAVGFSMGGGHALSWAARHQDPTRFRFAAVANHTGSASLRHTYHHSNDENLFRSPLMFGGTPEERPFDYTRASTLDLDPFTGQAGWETDMARNLAFTPTRHWSATSDPNAYLVEQTDAAHERLLRRGSASERTEVASARHDWTTVDAFEVVDWLAQHTARTPPADTVVRTLADRDARWFHFDVEQESEGAFTPFLWSARTDQNRLFVIEAANLASIGFHVDAVELDAARTFGVVLHATDASAPDVVIRGLAAPPTDVLRNGASTSLWTWDAAASTLTLHEPNAAAWGGWSVVP